MQNLINERLNQELRYRSRKLLIPHIMLLLATWMLLRHLPVYYPFFIILGGLCIRPFVFNHKFLFNASIVVSGSGWGILSYNVAHYLGLYSTESLYCLACIIIIVSAGITVFSASLLASCLFQFAASIIPVVMFLNDDGKNSYVLGILLGTNIFYQFYHSYISHTFILKSLKNEIAVTKQNQTLQSFIDAIPGLVTVIGHDQKFSMVNNYLNGSFKNFVGTKVNEFYPHSELTRRMMSFIKSGKMSEVHEVQSSDFGDENWFVMNLSRINSPENGLIAAILPITDLVKAKNDLKIQEARSQYAAKLASLGEVSAGIAHEVNNPLTIIEGSANLMKVLLMEDTIDRESLVKINAKIMDTTHRIAKIIKSLRTLAVNADEDPFKNVSFSSIIEPSLEIVKSKLDAHKVSLRVVAPEVDVQLFGNEIQLSQVVMNLISNAIDAVKDCADPRWIEVHYKPTLEWLDIVIQDNGPGVAPENREKIMEAFFTTKGTGHGTGLGLSISKAIVESHHGTLDLLPDEKFTTFRMRFPRMTVWQEVKKTDH